LSIIATGASEASVSADTDGSHSSEAIRIRVGIIHADLGDEVAKSGEEALELPTDKKQLVDSKRLGGDSLVRRRNH
jgi:hypothetical protein